jgi:hypothetical protein
MVMQAAGQADGQGLSQVDALDLQGIAIDEEAVDAVLDEMAIETALPLETQRWLVARGMAAAALAATVRLDEDYYRALGALGDGPASGDEYEFSMRFLARFSADVLESFHDDKAPGDGLTSELCRRLADHDAILGLLRAGRLND